jgi:hypothetical protein
MHDVGLIGCGQTNKGTPTLSSRFRQKATWITSAGAMWRVLSCARGQRLSSVRSRSGVGSICCLGSFIHAPAAGQTSRRTDHRGLPQDHPGLSQPRQRRRISGRRQARRRSSPGPPSCRRRRQDRRPCRSRCGRDRGDGEEAARRKQLAGRPGRLGPPDQAPARVNFFVRYVSIGAPLVPGWAFLERPAIPTVASCNHASLGRYPARSCCKSTGDRWIPVALPPPLTSCATKRVLVSWREK